MITKCRTTAEGTWNCDDGWARQESGVMVKALILPSCNPSSHSRASGLSIQSLQVYSVNVCYAAASPCRKRKKKTDLDRFLHLLGGITRPRQVWWAVHCPGRALQTRGILPTLDIRWFSKIIYGLCRGTSNGSDVLIRDLGHEEVHHIPCQILAGRRQRYNWKLYLDDKYFRVWNYRGGCGQWCAGLEASIWVNESDFCQVSWESALQC